MSDSLLPACLIIGMQMMLAMSVNMISGYAGHLSLGQAAFAAVGAYATAWLDQHLDLPFWAVCLLSLLLSGGVGFLCGLPGLRMPRHYLPAMTLGVGVLVQELPRRARLAGGLLGPGSPSTLRVADLTLPPSASLLLLLGAIVVCLLIDRCFRHAYAGRLQDDSRLLPAPAVRRAGLVAFATSTAMAGLVGSLSVYLRPLAPFDFNLEASVFALALAAGGGLGSVRGAMLGALLLGGLFPLVPSLTAYRLLLSGVVLLLVGLWFPRGLLSLLPPGFLRLTQDRHTPTGAA